MRPKGAAVPTRGLIAAQMLSFDLALIFERRIVFRGIAALVDQIRASQQVSRKILTLFPSGELANVIR